MCFGEELNGSTERVYVAVDCFCGNTVEEKSQI